MAGSITDVLNRIIASFQGIWLLFDPVPRAALRLPKAINLR